MVTMCARPFIRERYRKALASLSPYAPDYWKQQILRGMELCKKPYTPPVGSDRNWDSTNFIVDRNEGSLAGGLGELAVMMSGKYDQREIGIYLDKHHQHELGLDFRYGNDTHQVKSGIPRWSSGGIGVSKRHFDTSADWIHLLGNGYWFCGERDVWLELVDDCRQYCASVDEALPEQFTIEEAAMKKYGILILPTFDWAHK